ncbi:YHS domain-containing protein [Qaidamihabitans albus]|uniref:YHS domain-containing protein n=1 Tax=Qaidamihabitans albus TaxID=2795733 RepID=UPI0018F23F96|nr:YHS domain-containing protein [Qaidamihabitans albus]
MMFIEVFCPGGALDEQRRRVIGERLVTDVMQAGESDAPAEVIEAGRSLCHVVFPDLAGWYAGGRAVEAGEAPRYVVRAHVPESWRTDMSPYLVKAFIKVLADVDDAPQRLYDEPLAWIHVLGVPEDGMGAMGGPLSSTDLVKLVTRSHREAPRSAEGLPPGTGLDPVCGMTVPYDHAATTAEHDGTTYAFCSMGCYEVFAEEHS